MASYIAMYMYLPLTVMLLYYSTSSPDVVQWTLRITDTLVHRPLSVIRGVSFIGVFVCFCKSLGFPSKFMFNHYFIVNNVLL